VKDVHCVLFVPIDFLVGNLKKMTEQEMVIKKALRFLGNRRNDGCSSIDLLSSILELYEKERDKAFILSGYVPADVLDALSSGNASLGERRQASVLFIDICGYTSFSEKTDPERIFTVLNAVFKAVTLSAHRYGGIVDKFLGDGALVLFGVPRSHGDDPCRAVHAALEMLNEIKRLDLNSMLKLRSQAHLNVSVGINSGFLVTGCVGSSSRKEWTVIGDTVNLASRFCDLAEPGEIIVGQKTFESTCDRYLFEPLSLKHIKGKQCLVRAYRYKKTVRRKMITDKTKFFIGRQSELALLHDEYSRLKSGNSSMVWLHGAAGSGKTHLIKEWLNTLDNNHSNTVLFIDSAFETRDIPFAVIISSIRRHMGMPQNISINMLSGRVRALIRYLKGSRLDEVFIARWVEALAGGQFEREDSNCNSSSSLMREAFLLWLTLLSNKQPLILVIDNVQWFDRGSRGILDWIIPHLNQQHIMLVVVSRENNARFPGRNIRLGELTDTDAKALIQLLATRYQILQSDPERLHSKLGNNPFFIDIVLRYAGKNQVKPDDLLQNLPLNIHSVIQAQVDSLDSDSKRILDIMAAKGQHASIKLISDITGFSSETIHFSAAKLVSYGYVVFDFENTGYCFRQDVIRQTLYKTLLIDTRKQLHDQIADWLISNSDSTKLCPEAVAFHLEKGTDPCRSFHYLEKAAEKATAFFLYDTAIQLYEKGLKIMQDSCKDNLITRWKFIYRTGQLFHFKGMTSKAKEIFLRALDLANNVEHSSYFARSLIKIGDILADQGELRESLSFYEKAVTFFRNISDKEGEIQAIVALGNINTQLGDWKLADSIYQTGLKIAESLDNPQQAGVLYSNLGILNSVQNKFSEALEFHFESMHCFEMTGIREGIAQALHNIGMTFERLEDYECADTYYQRSQTISLETGDATMFAISMLNRSQICLEKADLPMARGLVLEAINKMQQLENRIGLADAYLILGKIEERSGNNRYAGALFALSYRTNRTTGYSIGQASAAAEYGKYLLKKGVLRRARPYLDEARFVFRKINDTHSAAGIEDVLNQLPPDTDDVSEASNGL
jgi:adenylate cyclase